MADCVTRVELHVSCRGLLDKDTTSKSDPLCALCIQDKDGKWVEVSFMLTTRYCIFSYCYPNFIRTQVKIQNS